MLDCHQMSMPLLVSGILDYAANVFSECRLISRENSGAIESTNYRQLGERCKRGAQSFAALGLRHGDRVGALAWSTRRYFELFYAVPGMGAVLHTINPRLHLDDLAYVINHAQDRLLCIDRHTYALAAELADRLETVEAYLWLDDPAALPEPPLFAELHVYDDLVAEAPGDYEWPTLSETSAATICYTSGTTGRPKGVVFGHRGLTLASLVALAQGIYGQRQPAGPDLSYLSVTGMFHANGWLLPYVAPLAGGRLVLPGSDYAPNKLLELLDLGEVTVIAGVNTIIAMLVGAAVTGSRDLGTLQRVIIGGSRPDRGLVETLSGRFGIEVGQVWGMTETSLGAGSIAFPCSADPDPAEAGARGCRGGHLQFGVQARLRSDAGTLLSRDSGEPGHLEIRSNWTAARYLSQEQAATTEDGWLPTGDIATLDDCGFLEIVDRAKDIIKSGGEWISSLQIEEIVDAHDGVIESAVVGIPHPKWEERPLLAVVKQPDHALDETAVRRWLDGKIARWWTPERIVFVDALPRTPVGKIAKSSLRETLLSDDAPA